MARPLAVVVMANPVRARKTAQVLECGGLEVIEMKELGELARALEEGCCPLFACFSGSDLEKGALALSPQTKSTTFAVIEDVDANIFLRVLEAPNVGGVIGVRYAGAPPRVWELIALARRVTLHQIPQPYTALSWGASWHERTLATTEDRLEAVEAVRNFCARLQSSRHAASMAQLADELMMNAMFDAPVDEKGHARYSHRRQERIQLEGRERPVLSFGSDGARIVIAVSDRYGRLARESVFRGLHRGLTTGTMDTSGGGAGLGLLLVHQAAQVVFFDVVPAQLTQVTAVAELDLPPRQMRKVPGSVHYISYEPSP